MNITQHESFKNCQGGLLCELVGGSHLYGLNTESSDIDYRGVFFARNPSFVSGLQNIESIVTNGEVDSTYYELVHFFKLLRKSNTQVLEILFAPKNSFTFLDYRFMEIKEYKYHLFDTEQLKKSLQGYFHSELRLATGERSGRLGGKRKEAVENYGFSPKNFTQIFRICEMGRRLFEEGELVVDTKLYGKSTHDFLMDVKTNPQNYKKETLVEIANLAFAEFLSAMDSSKVKYEFNEKIASKLILDIVP